MVTDRLRSRGQLLLVGAFVLAIGIFGLALVLNASLFTTTLAAEESGLSRGNGAVTAQESVHADVGNLLDRVNQQYDEGGVANPIAPYETAFVDTLPRLGEGIRDHHASRGVLVNVTEPASGPMLTKGVRIESHRDASGTPGRFWEPGSAPHTPNWYVVQGTTIRNATFVFREDLGGSTPFEIRFQNVVSGDDWTVEVDQISGDWRLTVKRGSAPAYGTTIGTCRRDGTDASGDPIPITVNLGTNMADGSYCHALAQLDPIGPYDLRFVNGDRIKGSFWLIAKDPGTVPPVLGAGNSDQEAVLYDATVRFRYHSTTVDYETDLTVAPEEV